MRRDEGRAARPCYRSETGCPRQQPLDRRSQSLRAAVDFPPRYSLVPAGRLSLSSDGIQPLQLYLPGTSSVHLRTCIQPAARSISSLGLPSSSARWPPQGGSPWLKVRFPACSRRPAGPLDQSLHVFEPPASKDRLDLAGVGASALGL